MSLLGKAAQRLSAGIKNAAGDRPPVPYVPERNGLFAGPTDDAVKAVAERAYDAYGSVGTLFAIVTQIDNAVASTDWHLYRKTSVRDKNRRQEVTVHPFLTVWDQPNKFYTNRMFIETVEQHINLVGEGIIVLDTIGSFVIGMWPVRPDRMQPVKSPDEFMTGWIYCGPDGEEVPLELDQVIQMKMPNPGDPYRGMGAVQTVLNDMDAARYSAEWNKNFFINGAKPGGVIEIDYRMGDDEFKDFVRRWRYQHQGVANAHRVAVLENAKWKDTQFSMSDMQFVELRNLPRELIREAFAFPKPMLGTVDDVNRANSDAAKEIMAEGITVPHLSRWRDATNWKLVPRFANGKTLEMDFDNPVPINREAQDRERTSQANGTATLVKAGFDPSGTLEAMGLPKIKWVGIPAGATSSGSKKEDDNFDQQLTDVRR